jgi:divalent metal cation (Fe/Co/Zn/Cd) transporter
VLWELSRTGEARQRTALRLIAGAFLALAAYLTIQTAVVLATGHHPRHSPLGIAWTAVTAIAMFTLAYGKTRTGQALGNPVLTTESRITVIDGRSGECSEVERPDRARGRGPARRCGQP